MQRLPTVASNRPTAVLFLSADRGQGYLYTALMRSSRASTSGLTPVVPADAPRRSRRSRKTRSCSRAHLMRNAAMCEPAITGYNHSPLPQRHAMAGQMALRVWDVEHGACAMLHHVQNSVAG